MTDTVRDSNGKRITRDIRRESDGTWGANVWFGGAVGPATTPRRYFYQTKAAARNAFDPRIAASSDCFCSRSSVRRMRAASSCSIRRRATSSSREGSDAMRNALRPPPEP